MSTHKHDGVKRTEACDCCRCCVHCGTNGRVSQGGGYNMLCPGCRAYVRSEIKAGRTTPFTI